MQAHRHLHDLVGSPNGEFHIEDYWIKCAGLTLSNDSIDRLEKFTTENDDDGYGWARYELLHDTDDETIYRLGSRLTIKCGDSIGWAELALRPEDLAVLSHKFIGQDGSESRVRASVDVKSVCRDIISAKICRDDLGFVNDKTWKGARMTEWRTTLYLLRYGHISDFNIPHSLLEDIEQAWMFDRVVGK